MPTLKKKPKSVAKTGSSTLSSKSSTEVVSPLTFRRNSERVWYDRQDLGYRITMTEYPINQHVGWTHCVTAEGKKLKKKRYQTSYADRFYACVRTAYGWQFAKHKKPYQTFESAVKACVWHYRIWMKVKKLTTARGNRVARICDVVAASRGRRSRSLEELITDNAFWRRCAYEAPDALTISPSWLSLDDKLAKLMTKCRTTVLADELKARAMRSPKRKSRATKSSRAAQT